MTLFKKLKSTRGFTLAELMIVVAIISILAGIAFIFVNPKDISYVEYNRSAEAIATAVQNRLTEIRNTGDMQELRKIGVRATQSAETGNPEKTATPIDGESSKTEGGYRYVYNYKYDGGAIVKNYDINYILPFGAIEYDLAQNYYAIGFQSDTGMVGEVFYSAEPFKTNNLTADYLVTLAGDPAKRKAENVGYYKGDWDDSEVAFANLPTPQLTITNYEELTLSIYLPKVKQLETYNKRLGFVISISDEDGKAYENGITINQTAIYSTFSLGNGSAAIDIYNNPQPIVAEQEISSGETYNIVLDTVKKCDENDMKANLSDGRLGKLTAKGNFESWAVRSQAFKDEKQYFLLGDNSTVTVTVYCLYNEGDDKYDKNFPVDPTFMPRSASLTFNGWFNNYYEEKNSEGKVTYKTVEIACGRHLQNLGNLAELREKLQKYLPIVTEKNGVYEYGDYNYGMADAYTDGTDNDSPKVEYDDITNKYVLRSCVKDITKAKQVNAIDFACAEWKNGDKQIPFTPICLPEGFRYYGNYLTINHLYVNSPFYAGLFGYAFHPRLYDILLVNPSVTSQAPAHLAEMYEMGVGALIGTSRDSSHINNCQAYMTPDNADGKYNSEKYRVQGEFYVGGLIGFCEDEHIENCSASVYTGYAKDATKTVVGEDGETTAPISSHYVGGLIGCITGDSKIKNCYAAGNLSGNYVGGLVGFIVEDSDPSGDDYRIESCYTAGHIEYALNSAAGILGLVSELSGDARSALSVKGNYCVIIYGQKNSAGEYEWQGSAPIYGTFKGDGFEWLGTSDFNGYSSTYLKGKYGGHTYFAGAVFKNNNKNYYIAQSGISYANSPYYTSMNAVAKQFVEEAKSITDKSELVKLAEKYEQKLKWLKKIQVLEDLKTLMERLINEIEQETGIGKDGRPYNHGGYYTDKTGNIYLDLDRARFDDLSDVKNHNYVTVTVEQAIHAIYDGTYTEVITDEEGKTTTQTKTVTIAYNGDDSAKKDFKEMSNHTFMSYYNELKKQYEILADGTDETKVTAAKERLTLLLGDNSKETYVEDVKHSDGTTTQETKQFYEAGLFYKSFETELLYRLIDKAKDYYQTDIGDKTGELLYRHFRSDYVTSGFVGLLCDLAMSDEGREEMLTKAKTSELDSVLTMLDTYNTLAGKWKGEMKSFTSQAQGLIKSAKDAVDTLKKDVASSSTLLSTLEADIKAADNAFVAMYDFYEKHKNDKDVSVDSDFKEISSGDMRNFRDYTSQLRRSVQLCAATSDSGAQAELEILIKRLNDNSPKVTELRDKCIKNLQVYIDTDSGHRLKNAEELRNAARGFVNGDDTETRDETLGFMYDYGNSYWSNYKDINPYTNSNSVTGDCYVDEDNGIYNNVFPYIENQYTRYYPFPFVYARDVEDGERVLYVLFHYGDWLTEDLWAAPTVTYHTDYPEGYSGGNITLSKYRVTNVNSFAPDEDIITSNDENIDTPFYFEGWYVDEDRTTPYDEDTFRTLLETAAINGEEKNFDLYAKWTAKPSLTFYADDLEGNYNGNTIIVDTKITLTSGGTSKTSEKANSYQKFTVWFKPEQDVLLSVIGHYKYNSFFGNREVTDWVFEDQEGKKTYLFDSLTVVQPTEFTGAVWFGNDNKNKDTGEVTFTVPADATDSDKYEITLSEQSSSGGFEFNICLAEGTMIRMADGSKKTVENLEVGDTVLAFNHLTGKYEPTAVWITPHTDLGSKLYIVTTLDFSDGSSLKIVGEHGLFDRTLNKYVFINENNYNEYIGHTFSAVTATESGFKDRTVTLASVSVNSEITKIYSPVTENQLNIVAEDLLTVTAMMGYGDAVMNIFDYNTDMSYDKIGMATDIEKYGVYSYDDFADLLPQEVFDKVPLKVMKVAVGKGLISYEEVKQIIEYIYKNGYLS